MSSEEFEKLHEMFQSQFDEVKMMSGRALTSQGEEKKRSIRVFEKQLEDAEEMLQGMESELFGAPSSFRTPMTTKIRIYRRDLAKLQRDVRSSVAFGASDTHSRSGLFAAQNEQSTQLQSQRALLIQGTESLKNATKSIERSHQIAAETDQIGTDIIEELGEQREQLDRTRGRLVNTGENLTRSRKILRAMSRRLVTNKLLLSIIIIMELAILGAVVYLKFFRKT